MGAGGFRAICTMKQMCPLVDLFELNLQVNTKIKYFYKYVIINNTMWPRKAAWILMAAMSIGLWGRGGDSWLHLMLVPLSPLLQPIRSADFS
jgi:hypothetical protein